MLKVLNHPLITHKLAQMRKVETGTKDFRQNLDEIAGLMAYEICRDLPTKPVTIQTPICECQTEELSKEIVLIPILRAGLGLVNGITDLIPTAKVGFIGLYRDEETLQPHEYFAKFPNTMPDAVNMVLDPMLATGSSAPASEKYRPGADAGLHHRGVDPGADPDRTGAGPCLRHKPLGRNRGPCLRRALRVRGFVAADKNEIRKTYA